MKTVLAFVFVLMLASAPAQANGLTAVLKAPVKAAVVSMKITRASVAFAIRHTSQVVGTAVEKAGVVAEKAGEGIVKAGEALASGVEKL